MGLGRVTRLLAVAACLLACDAHGGAPQDPAGAPDGQDTCACEDELECVCAMSECSTKTEAIHSVSCLANSPSASLTRGCGVSVVVLRTAVWARQLAYNDDSDELLGALTSADVPFGPCDKHTYNAHVPDLSACEGFRQCDLCDDDCRATALTSD